MKFINSWSSSVKQNDKINITIRIGKITLFELKYDVSDKALRLLILGFGFDHKWQS